MPKLVNRPPKLRRHVCGQGIVTIGGRDHYCGKWPKGTKAPKTVLTNYKRVLAEYWEADVPPPKTDPEEITILEVMDLYWRHVKDWYQKNGQPTSEVNCIKDSLKPLKELFGTTRALDFGPLQLKALRTHLYKHTNLSRNVLNNRISRVKRMFKWAATNIIKNNKAVLVQVYDQIKYVEGFPQGYQKKGCRKLLDPEEITPVPDDVIQRTLPHLPKTVADMVRLQRLIGCRPGEVLHPQTDRRGPIRRCVGLQAPDAQDFSLGQEASDLYWSQGARSAGTILASPL